MDDNQSNRQEQNQQSQEQNQQPDMTQINAAMDSAALAAKGIADAAGLQDGEAMAVQLNDAIARIKQLEAALPLLSDAFEAGKRAVSAVESELPVGFVSRVEGFFTRHFPMHAAPAVTVDSAAKTE